MLYLYFFCLFSLTQWLRYSQFHYCYLVIIVLDYFLTWDKKVHTQYICQGIINICNTIGVSYPYRYWCTCTKGVNGYATWHKLFSHMKTDKVEQRA